MGWDASHWTAGRLALAHAVYTAARREAPYVPMATPLGHGNLLLRSFPRHHLGAGTPASIDQQVVLESIRVRDAAQDQNRFSGPLPRHQQQPAVRPLRGGLYCSEDIRAAIAELLHYADPALARQLIGRPERLAPFTRRCFVSLRPAGELDVASLNGESAAMLPFLRRLEQDAAVAAALQAAGYPSLFKAVYAADDYAAARGLGLGLEANAGIDGLQVLSARDYETDAGSGRVMRNGDNVLLFGLDQHLAIDKLRIVALHLVDPEAGSTAMKVTHYAPGAGGKFVRTSAARFLP